MPVAESVGLKMPRSTVVVFGNPRLGTPVFIQASDSRDRLPLALVWEDASGKVSVRQLRTISGHIYGRHDAPANSEAVERIVCTKLFGAGINYSEVRDMAKQCFKWISERQQVKVREWHARLIMVKNTAYAWRQMVFFQR